MLPVDCSTTFKIWLWGLFGQQLNGIGPLRAIYFSPTFVSVSLAFCRLTCPHEHLGWQLQDFTDLLWLHSWLSSSLGLLLWGNAPQFIPKFVFVSHRFFFFLIVHCLLQKQRLGSWAEVEMQGLIPHHFTQNWSCCNFIPGLIWFTMCIRVPLLYPLLSCILNFTFMRLTLWYAPNLSLHFPAMAFPI